MLFTFGAGALSVASSRAMVLPISVFPVPGGPYSKMPAKAYGGKLAFCNGK